MVGRVWLVAWLCMCMTGCSVIDALSATEEGPSDAGAEIADATVGYDADSDAMPSANDAGYDAMHDAGDEDIDAGPSDAGILEVSGRIGGAASTSVGNLEVRAGTFVIGERTCANSLCVTGGISP